MKHENQFEVNALTAFLFEKYGFEVLYKERVPSGIDACDVLRANVHSKSGLFRSRLYVTLEDCNNHIIFTSQTGASGEKDFRRSYHEALREAFTSFEELPEDLSVKSKTVTGDKVSTDESVPAEVIIDPTPSPNEPDVVQEDLKVVIDPVVTAEEIEKASDEDVVQLVNGNISYQLKPTPEGHVMFREKEEEKFATLIKSGGGDNFLYSSKNVSGNAFFDTNGNLVVEYLDPHTQQLVTVIYKPKN
ncbi:hypothetical protein ACXYMT_14880 [Salinimicrobium sp. CAU 1759]